MLANAKVVNGTKRVNQMGKAVSRLHTIWVDGGFDGEPFMRWVMDVCRWLFRWCYDQSKPKDLSCLKRWVVERTFGWMMSTRRLVRDYELLPETSETFIYLATIRSWSGAWHRIWPQNFSNILSAIVPESPRIAAAIPQHWGIENSLHAFAGCHLLKMLVEFSPHNLPVSLLPNALNRESSFSAAQAKIDAGGDEWCLHVDGTRVQRYLSPSKI